MVEIVKKSFNALSVNELYQILKLRSDIFVVEQTAIYNDLDDLDKDAMHYYIYDNGRIVAYVRTMPTGIKFDQGATIGRIITDKAYRSKGHARTLINQAIQDLFVSEQSIIIEGQAYLKDYYQSFGFKIISSLYLIDGIDHYKMILEKDKQ